MNIKHVISSIDKSTGGPARSVTHLIDSILSENVDIEIVLDTLESDTPLTKSFCSDFGEIVFHKFSVLQYSKSLNYGLNKLDADLFHGHGLWQLPVHQMAAAARKNDIPYIITPRGMLEPWSLAQNRVKKQIALKLFQFNDLKRATCIHATAPMEVESIRKLGLKNPIAMIPNGIQIDDFPEMVPKKNDEPKKILFLSRIHVKKGIENLIQAWSLIDESLRQGWVIDIVGNGDTNYIDLLNQLIIKNDLIDQILIRKPVFGKEKVDLFRNASLFVLPTFSENFGIVIAEALASYTPVITTVGAPWEELDSNNCGWWIDIGLSPLQDALEKALSASPEDLKIKGNNGRELIKEKYSMQSVAKQMLQLYDWILTKSEKPKFVDTL